MWLMTKSTCGIGPLSDSTLHTGEGIDAFAFVGFNIRCIYDIII